jgi:hypothetical protein
MQTGNKDELRKKLREKLQNKKILRSNKDQKETFVNDNLKKMGIQNPDKFKEDLKKLNPDKLNPDKLKNELKKFNINL